MSFLLGGLLSSSSCFMFSLSRSLGRCRKSMLRPDVFCCVSLWNRQKTPARNARLLPFWTRYSPKLNTLIKFPHKQTHCGEKFFTFDVPWLSCLARSEVRSNILARGRWNWVVSEARLSWMEFPWRELTGSGQNEKYPNFISSRSEQRNHQKSSTMEWNISERVESCLVFVPWNQILLYFSRLDMIIREVCNFR